MRKLTIATLLATPCSAPFLGTAVGFALAGGTADIFAVFIALGLGLASAIVPGLAKASGGIVALQGVPGETWAMGLALMAAIGVAVGLLPALRARGLKIVDALAGR